MIPLQSQGGIVRANVYRPKSGADENMKFPVLATYGPYGKDIHYREYEALPRHSCLQSLTRSTAFIRSLSPSFQRSRSLPILLGKLQIRAIGHAKALPSSVRMRSGLGRVRVLWTRCPHQPAHVSKMSSNGRQINRGRTGRSVCWASATMLEANGASLHVSSRHFFSCTFSLDIAQPFHSRPLSSRDDELQRESPGHAKPRQAKQLCEVEPSHLGVRRRCSQC